MEPHSPPGLPAKEPAEPSRTADSSLRPDPKLGIVHLLVWIGCAVLYFSLTRLISEKMDAPRVGSFDIFDVLQVAHGIGAAVGIGYVAMLLRRRWYDMPFPLHPGEFLAVLFGINVLVALVARGILAFIGADWPLHHVTLIPYCLVLAIFVNWSVRATPERHWRVFLIVFGIVALIRLAQPTSQLVSMARTFGSLPLMSLLAAVILVDVTRRVPRPWTHWGGMGLQMWTWVIQSIVWLIVMQKLGRGFWQ